MEQKKTSGAWAGRGSWQPLYAVAGFVACIIAPAFAAETYPARPIRMIVPIAAGGGTDIIARIVAQGLNAAWKQPVIIDNRPGAGGVIGMRTAAQAPADGYTLLTGNIGSIAISPSLFKSASYDTLRDFEPVALLATAPITLVAHVSIKERSVKELVEGMRANPNVYNIASSGIGQSTHLAAELFRIHTGVKSVIVPYRGAAPAITDLLGGNVQLIFDATQALPHVRAGKLRAMAVASARPFALYPGVPTMAEAGLPGFEVSTWFGMLAPKGTLKAIVDRINREVVRIMSQQTVRQQVLDVTMSEVVTSSPAEFGEFIRKEIARWREVIQKTGIRED